MKALLQKKFITWITHNLFNFVTAEDILRRDEWGNYWIKGRKLDDAEKQSLQNDASAFKDSIIWKALEAEVKYQANVRIYYKSSDAYDLVAPKAMLETVRIINEKLQELSR